MDVLSTIIFMLVISFPLTAGLNNTEIADVVIAFETVYRGPDESSWSRIPPKNITALANWINEIAGQLSLGNDETRISVVMVSQLGANVMLKLKDGVSVGNVNSTMANASVVIQFVPPMSEKAVMAQIRKKALRQSEGDRQHVPNLIIIITLHSQASEAKIAAVVKSPGWLGADFVVAVEEYARNHYAVAFDRVTQQYVLPGQRVKFDHLAAPIANALKERISSIDSGDESPGTTQKDPGVREGTHSEEITGKSNLPMWAIGLIIAIVSLIVIFATILIILLVVRGRKHRQLPGKHGGMQFKTRLAKSTATFGPTTASATMTVKHGGNQSKAQLVKNAATSGQSTTTTTSATMSRSATGTYSSAAPITGTHSPATTIGGSQTQATPWSERTRSGYRARSADKKRRDEPRVRTPRRYLSTSAGTPNAAHGQHGSKAKMASREKEHQYIVVKS